MRKFIGLICVFALAMAFGFAGTANADPTLSKEITGGEDRPDALDGTGDNDGEIDLVLPAPGGGDLRV